MQIAEKLRRPGKWPGQGKYSSLNTAHRKTQRITQRHPEASACGEGKKEQYPSYIVTGLSEDHAEIGGFKILLTTAGNGKVPSGVSDDVRM